MEKTTFIYALKDPETRHIRYIGKADNLKRRLAVHLCDKCRCHRTNWIAGLKSRGLIPEIEALLIVPFSEWPEWEIKFISKARALGIDLINQTLGGDGPMMGKEQSAETIAKRVAKLIGQKRTEEQCKRMGAAQKGKYVSPQTRARQSAAKLGKPRPPRTPEHCANISKAQTGRVASQETRNNMRAARLRYLESQRQ